MRHHAGKHSGRTFRAMTAVLAIAAMFGGSVPVYAAVGDTTDLVQAETVTADATKQAVIYDPNDITVIPPAGLAATKMGWMWSNGDGSYAKGFIHTEDDRLYYANEQGIVQFGFATVVDKLYYFRTDGSWQPGWNMTEDGHHFFLNMTDLHVETNTTIGGYVVGADGIAFVPEGQSFVPDGNAAPVVDRAFYDKVQTLIARVTTPQMTPSEKLQACFDYVLGASYKRTYETPAGDWTKAYANDIYDTGRGNCYRYAAAFAYLARGLGYDCHVCTGVTAAARGGVTPHGWVEINYNGKWLICDPDIADAKGPGYYMVTFARYPMKPLVTENIWPIEF